MPATLSVRDLEIKYTTREATLTAIRRVSFGVQAGQIVGLVGESGCGKSTIASAVMCLLPPNGRITGGEVVFKGRDLRRLDEGEIRQVRGREIAMIFQDPMTSLNPVFTIEEQMVDAYLAKAPGGQASRAEARQKAMEMLARVGIPDAAERLRAYPHQFSGGMRQRIMIAMALQSNPALLIADEPTSALDVTLEAQIVDLIRGLRDELGTAILYITHDLGVVAQLCDYVVVLYMGGIAEQGDVFGVFKSPQHPYTRALLRSHPAHQVNVARLATIPGRVPSLRDLPAGCKFSPRCPLAEAVCFEQDPLPHEIGGQKVACHAFARGWIGKSVEVLELATATSPSLQPPPRQTADRRVVQAAELKTHYRDRIGLLGKLLGQKEGVVRALDGVDIAVYRGETLAVVGESGSGKTTLGRTILRLEQPTAGEIVIDGQDITSLPQGKVRPLRLRMQMIFQDPVSSLSPRKKVSELLLEPFRIHGLPVDPQTKVEQLLEMVGLSAEQADKYPHQLSGGQARRVGIARALALEPDLLVADEPTAGLDVSVAAGILNLIKDLRERLGLTYIIITHNLTVIGFIADRVAVMYLGKVVEVGDTGALFRQPLHPYTEALLSAVAAPDPELRGARRRIILEGEIPSPRNPPPGCPFHPRCRYRQERCGKEIPPLRSVGEGERLSACHFAEKLITPGD